MSRFDFRYGGQNGYVDLARSQARIYLGGSFLGTARYVNGQLSMRPVHPCSVEAAAAVRRGRGDALGQLQLDVGPEANVRREVREAIGSLPGVYLMNNPVGQARFYGPDGSERPVNYGLELGSPDLVLMLLWKREPVRGAQWVAIELKAPGKTPREEQAECHARWIAAGAWVATCTNGPAAVRFLEQCKARLRAAGLEVP